MLPFWLGLVKNFTFLHLKVKYNDDDDNDDDNNSNNNNNFFSGCTSSVALSRNIRLYLKYLKMVTKYTAA